MRLLGPDEWQSVNDLIGQVISRLIGWLIGD
jgi:hypothetical protein